MKIKSRDLLILGGLAAVAYLLYQKKQAQPDLLGGAGGALQGALDAVGQGVQNAVQGVQNAVGGAAGVYAGTVGTVYGAVNRPAALGQATAAQTQAFSDAFNTYVGGGNQYTTVSALGNAINLNPALLTNGGLSSTGVYQGAAAIVQNALTQASIGAGIGVASLAPWAGGGVATNYSALNLKPTATSGGTAGLSTSSNPSNWQSKVPVMQSKVPTYQSTVRKA